MISPEDVSLWRATDDVDEAVSEIERFYRVFHSQRYVGSRLVIRLRRKLAPAAVAEITSRFGDILDGPAEQTDGPLAAEEEAFPELPRLLLPFSRRNQGRLRQLIDFLNTP
jgi:hypothetical protein